jgi:hypothetical protein
MRYKVSYEFRAKVTVAVEAESCAAAENAGLPEAEEEARLNLSYYDSTARPLDKKPE